MKTGRSRLTTKPPTVPAEPQRAWTLPDSEMALSVRGAAAGFNQLESNLDQ